MILIPGLIWLQWLLTQSPKCSAVFILHGFWCILAQGSFQRKYWDFYWQETSYARGRVFKRSVRRIAQCFIEDNRSELLHNKAGHTETLMILELSGSEVKLQVEAKLRWSFGLCMYCLATEKVQIWRE